MYAIPFSLAHRFERRPKPLIGSAFHSDLPFPLGLHRSLKVLARSSCLRRVCVTKRAIIRVDRRPVCLWILYSPRGKICAPVESYGANSPRFFKLWP